ncbi:hypothetical protein [Desulfoluna butyratoxydans]|uniref:Uncharacterized protein n=1 Tax=Desulfoluna butyratoxydans TaxID=231438 RepID=A0A4U8YTZ0_9BACT|nr:hypothetical protein [Desulfoluna butyratoxydans]VFQ45342.1 hypothetical protein MSL71_29990 [Desulfoluna butyratoxydans]
MYEQIEKTQENKRKSISDAGSLIQGRGISTDQFVDNRPESIQMQKLKNLSCNSPQVQPLRAFKNMAAANSVAQKKGNVKQRFGLNAPQLISTVTTDLNALSSSGALVAQRKLNVSGLIVDIQSLSEDERPVEIGKIIEALRLYQKTPGDEALAEVIRACAAASSATSKYEAAIRKIRNAYAEEISKRMVRAQKEWPAFDKQQVKVTDSTKKHAAKGRDVVELASTLIKAGQLGKAHNLLIDFIVNYWIKNTHEKVKKIDYSYDISISPKDNGSGFYSTAKKGDPRYFPNQGIKIPYMEATESQWESIELLKSSNELDDVNAFHFATFAVMTILEEVMHLVQEHMGIWHSPDTGEFATKSGVKLSFDEGLTDFDEADILAWIMEQDFPAWAIEEWGEHSAYSMRSKFLKWKG